MCKSEVINIIKNWKNKMENENAQFFFSSKSKASVKVITD